MNPNESKSKGENENSTETKEHSTENNENPTENNEQDSTNLEHSGESDLEIVLNSSISSTQSGESSQTEDNEESFFQNVEEEIEKQLTEESVNDKLTVANVKLIIRKVLNREHIKSLLNKTEGENTDLSVLRPTLTRAKAKELLSSNAIPVPPVILPWVPESPRSETRVLIGDDLKEEDSGDEYVPGDEDSEDESVPNESDVSSLPPPTPPTPVSVEDHSTQTTAHYTDDGIFKIPPPKTGPNEPLDEINQANIALRTRSKINLSSTPLEVIEKNFVPPDVTNDMYDLECDDDDDWKQFLQGFMKPLEELTKPVEDEEHDPEYNINADDQINKIDNEEFRIDDTVEISNKEIKELFKELFGYLDNTSEENEEQMQNKDLCIVNEDGQTQNIDFSVEEPLIQTLTSTENEKLNSSKQALFEFTIQQEQLSILEQQMRQHVQMLTQNFLLTYKHPEFHDYSTQFREYLLNLKFLGEEKIYSVFKPVNLLSAIKITEDWIGTFSENSDTVKATKQHVQEELLKTLRYKVTGNYAYIPTFPTLLLETISQSDVFIYPSLLPKIPFKSKEFFSNCYFTDAENRLLAFGIDQFKYLFSEDKRNSKDTCLRKIVNHIQEYIMPHRDPVSIYKHIHSLNHTKAMRNPIQQYLIYNKIPPIMHQIHSLNELIPPCRRIPDELPKQWKDFIYPEGNSNIQQLQNIQLNSALVPQQLILLPSTIPITTTLCTSPIILSPCGVNVLKNNTGNTLTPKKGRAKKQITLFESPQLQITKNESLKRVTTKRKPTKIESFLSIFRRPVKLQRLVNFLINIDIEAANRTTSHDCFCDNTILDKMPAVNSNSLVKNADTTEDCVVTSTTDETTSIHVSEVRTSKSVDSENVKAEMSKNISVNRPLKTAKNIDFSTITSGSFQTAHTSTEVEFSRNFEEVQIRQTTHTDEGETPTFNVASLQQEKDNPEDINAFLIASSTVPPNVKTNGRKKIPTGERKKNKLRKEFLSNLSIATPDSPETEKVKNEKFALVYYEKLCDTLESQDYIKIMQILNDFESGDVIDLYNKVQKILRPNYEELAEDFLFFLREKEAAAVGKLIPWLELQARVKFIRKLEIAFKEQPTQLKKIYNTLIEFTKTDNFSMEKIKMVLLPMLKGNKILIDLFLQNFKDEHPPSSLLEGPYEKIDVNKELSRPENENFYDTFVVPNTEDKYGGQNCICHCHKIEDKEYKSRYKHCNLCGLKFANGRLYLSTGRTFQPAVVTFKTSPNVNHNIRLMGKSATPCTVKRKRSDNSPHKASHTAKDTLEEDTEDEEGAKRKKSVSQRTPRKRKKCEPNQHQEITNKHNPTKKSPRRYNDSFDISNKDSIKPRKRTYSGRKTKKDDAKKVTIQMELPKLEPVKFSEDCEVIAEIEENEPNEAPQTSKPTTDDCTESSGESLEKPLTPGQQTAESETEIYLEESSQDNYETDDSCSSSESAKGSQSDSNTNDEPAWQRDEDTIILETLQKEDDKEYALQIISDKLPNRTVGQIRSRLSRLMDLLIKTLKNT
ncbi:hypothetical protein ABEB36_002583 [Hypothenemus hampei]|uniref:GON-4-like protein n=1 Tax=Hypothenemus hampei TaxID=57062 RepID=A0ABD1F6C5_HYPHA